MIKYYAENHMYTLLFKKQGDITFYLNTITNRWCVFRYNNGVISSLKEVSIDEFLKISKNLTYNEHVLNCVKKELFYDDLLSN